MNDPLLTPDLPDVVSLEVTTLCTRTCRMCALLCGGTRSSRQPGHVGEVLLERFVALAARVGRVNLNGWGESLTNPDFLPFLLRLDDLGVVTDFSTNGSLLTTEAVRVLSRLRHLVRINVSVDSPDPEVYRRIRGGDLTSVLEGVDRLTSSLSDPEAVTVSSVLLGENLDSLSLFPPLLARLGVRGWVLQGLVDFLDAADVQCLDHGVKTRCRIESLESDCQRLGISLLVMPNLDRKIQGEEPAIWKTIPPVLADAHIESKTASTKQCGAPWEHVFVNKDGLVLPCACCPPWEESAKDSLNVMGDLNNSSFEEIWHGERFRTFREAMLHGPPPDICLTCRLASSGPHFLRLLSARIVDGPSRVRGDHFRLIVENTGELTWTSGTKLCIGTVRPRDRESHLFHSSWLSPDRVATIAESEVPPGTTATFLFQLKRSNATRRERFQLLSEGACWLPGTEFELATNQPHPPICVDHDAHGTARQPLSDHLADPGPPVAVQVELTSRCNLRCGLCPRTNQATASSCSPGEMDETVWADVLSAAQKAGRAILAGFGEPLLDPAFLPRLTKLDDAGVRTSFSTNGLLLTPALAAELSGLGSLEGINVSVDAPNRELYSDLRGADLDIVLGGIAELTSRLQNPDLVSVSSVATVRNATALVDFPPLLARLGVRRWVVQGLGEWVPKASGQHLLTKRLDIGLYESLTAACNTYGVEFRPTQPERLKLELVDPDEARRRYFGPLEPGHGTTRACTIPWEMPYVDKDGRVFPCCVPSPDPPVGNLRRSRLEDIWRGPRYKTLRDSLLTSECLPVQCSSCTAVQIGVHPHQLFAAHLQFDQSNLQGTLQPILRARNVGVTTWKNGSIRIGSARPRDRASELEHPSWYAPNRTGTFQEGWVRPGETATFSFDVAPNGSAGSESFQLVADGICWIPGTEFQVGPLSPTSEGP